MTLKSRKNRTFTNEGYTTLHFYNSHFTCLYGYYTTRCVIAQQLFRLQIEDDKSKTTLAIKMV